MNNSKKDRTGLVSPNRVIQICLVCDKIDAYLGDNHSCAEHLIRAENRSNMED